MCQFSPKVEEYSVLIFVFVIVNSFIFLLLENYGMRKLEAVFAVLITTMALSFAWMFGDTKPSGKKLLIGKLLLLLSIT